MKGTQLVQLSRETVKNSMKSNKDDDVNEDSQNKDDNSFIFQTS